MVESGEHDDRNAAQDEITRVLRAAADGDEQAADHLLPLVYQELKILAHGRLARLGRGETLQTTDLVHESWMRLSGVGEPSWENRRHFFGAAARAMRNILIEQARRKSTLKRDATRKRTIQPDQPELVVEAPGEDAVALAELLEELEADHPRPAQVVSLRFFTGLSMPEVAEMVDVSLATAERDWRFARAWLQQRLEE